MHVQHIGKKVHLYENQKTVSSTPSRSIYRVIIFLWFIKFFLKGNRIQQSSVVLALLFYSRNVEGPGSTCNIFKSCFNRKWVPPRRLLIPQALFEATSEEIGGGALPLQAGTLKTSQHWHTVYLYQKHFQFWEQKKKKKKKRKLLGSFFFAWSRG